MSSAELENNNQENSEVFSSSSSPSSPSNPTDPSNSSTIPLAERRLKKKLLAKAKRENKITLDKKKSLIFSKPIIKGPTRDKIIQPKILKEKTIINEPIIYNENNQNVYVKPSTVPSSGNGLFAKKFIKKGEYIATYSGQLVDENEAKYINPCYIVNYENGKGYKLVGDNIDGDTGHFANSICNEFWLKKMNDLKKEFYLLTFKGKNKILREKFLSVDKETEIITRINNNLIKNAKFDFNNRKIYGKLRGRFDLVATQDIEKDTEIFVSYGEGYWNTVFNWMAYGPFIKPQTVVERDNRAKSREELKKN